MPVWLWSLPSVLTLLIGLARGRSVLVSCMLAAFSGLGLIVVVCLPRTKAHQLAYDARLSDPPSYQPPTTPDLAGWGRDFKMHSVAQVAPGRHRVPRGKHALPR